MVTLMDKGVHDSMIHFKYPEPLNEISRGRLGEYRNMLKLYSESDLAVHRCFSGEADQTYSSQESTH